MRVSQNLCPLTSILSPGGERRYIRCYFQANCIYTKDQIPPSLPLLKGGIPLFGILFLSLDRQKGVRGDFQKNMSSQLWTPY
jgi:hypothetical protein